MRPSLVLLIVLFALIVSEFADCHLMKKFKKLKRLRFLKKKMRMKKINVYFVMNKFPKRKFMKFGKRDVSNQELDLEHWSSNSTINTKL